MSGLHRLAEGDAGFFCETLLCLCFGYVGKCLGTPPRHRDRQRQSKSLLAQAQICLSADDLRERPAAARIILDRLGNPQRFAEDAVARRCRET